MGKHDFIFKRSRSKYWVLRLAQLSPDGRRRRTKYWSTKKENYDDARSWAEFKILGMKQYNDSIKREASYYSQLGAELPPQGERELYLKLAPGESKIYDNNIRGFPSADGSMVEKRDPKGFLVGTESNIIAEKLKAKSKTLKKLENRLRIVDDLDEREIQVWIDTKGIPSGRETHARKVHRELRRLAQGRNFSCYIERDVSALISGWQRSGRYTQESMKTAIGHLRGMLKTAIASEKFPEVNNNVFRDVVIPAGAKSRREAVCLFSDQDHAVIMNDLPQWPVEPRLLYLLGRFCGTHREECWLIEREEEHCGLRCFVIDKDRAKSSRNPFANRLIPIPLSVLPYFETKAIDGCLFEHSMSHVAGEMQRRVGALLKQTRSSHLGKTHKSLRQEHKMKLEKESPQRIVDAILGNVPSCVKTRVDRTRRDVQEEFLIANPLFQGNKVTELFNALNAVTV